MDIYVAKDGIYPDCSISKHNEAFILLGDHTPFITNKLRSIKTVNATVYTATYTITPTESGKLIPILESSSVKIHDNNLSPVVFLESPLAFPLIPVPDTAGITATGTAITMYCMYICTNSLVRCIIFIQCPDSMDVPTNVTVKGVKVDDISFFYTDPLLVLESTADKPTMRELFARSVTRAAINQAIHDMEESALFNIVRELLPSIPTQWIVITNRTEADSRLVFLDHNRNRLRSFIYAWYSCQLGSMVGENEKISAAYDIISRII